MILFFSMFLDLKKYFLLTFLLIRLKPKQTFCIPKHLLKDAVQDVGICSVKCCIILTCFVYMAIYDLEI